MKKIALILLTLVLFGCGKSNETKDIIDNVESAYDKAYTGSYPTVERVKSNYSLEGTNWLGSQIISDTGIVCDIRTDNSLLVVDCPSMKSTKEMRISK